MVFPVLRTDLTSGFTVKGEDIVESDAELDEILVRTNKIAGLTKQSREAMTHTTSSDRLATGMQRSVVIKANTALLAENKTRELGSPAEQAERKLYGLPVHVTPQMDSGNILVIDSANLIAAIGDISLESDKSFYFGSDGVAHRL